MRRVRFRCGVLSLLVSGLASGLVATAPVGRPALAAPSPAASGGAPATACTITADDMSGLSGLVATSSGYVLINDSQPTKANNKLFFLNSNCQRQNAVAYPTDPLDPEDLALAPDGTFWIADTGDSPPASGDKSKRRETIALWSYKPGGGKPVIHRFKYPDPPHDAEALLIDQNNNPIIITKQDEPSAMGSAAQLFMPAEAIQSNNTAGVPLKKVGEVKLPATETPTPLGAVGRALVTGAATSPDRKRVALRTYADAFEWSVPDGDVVKAITSTAPRITALPGETTGEALSYTADGTAFLTVADIDDGSASGVPIRRYAPAAATTTSATSKPAPSSQVETSWLDSFTPQELTYMVSGFGALLGLCLVGAGVAGIRHSRQQRRVAAKTSGSASARAAVAVPALEAAPPARDDSWLPDLPDPLPGVTRLGGEPSASRGDTGSVGRRGVPDVGEFEHPREHPRREHPRDRGHDHRESGDGGRVYGSPGAAGAEAPDRAEPVRPVHTNPPAGGTVYGRAPGPWDEPADQDSPAPRRHADYHNTPYRGSW